MEDADIAIRRIEQARATQYDAHVRREIAQARDVLGISRDRSVLSDDAAGWVWAGVVAGCGLAGALATNSGVGVLVGMVVAVAVMWGVGLVTRR